MLKNISTASSNVMELHSALLIKSFPKAPRTKFEASQFTGSHNYKTKQTTFIDRIAKIGMGIKDQTSLVFYYEILRSIPMLASD
jgi:hypothetical protein